MSKIINITDKLSSEKPKLQIGEDIYEVNDSMNTVLKFQELSQDSGFENLEKAVELAIGEKPAKKLCIKEMSLSNFKVIVTSIMAAMQGLEYEEAATRFQI